MSGSWINCEGSLKPPAPGLPPLPKWVGRSSSAAFQESIRREYGACSVCAKPVKLRNDGTVRVHVNTDEAREIRRVDAEQVRDAAVSDLLKMREELSGG